MATKKSSPAVETVEEVEAADLLRVVNDGIMQMIETHGRDAYDAWVKGKSYLCRLVDLVNMGKVTHLICGREAVRELPALAAEWAARWDNQEQ